MVVPIVVQGDAIGSVTVISPGEKALSEVELKAAEIGADFLAKQLYD